MAGDLRTRIRILRPEDHPTAGNHRNTEYIPLYDDDRIVRCRWVTAYGTEAVTASSLKIRDLATLTLRYDPRITADCVVERVDNGVQYEIISQPNDVGDAHRWLELKVRGRVKAR
ncbi:MAG: phage head closure protein [Oscillospiraceae bacterium]|nr:phage head closure protein [Oscillospiraceae bacterium]